MCQIARHCEPGATKLIQLSAAKTIFGWPLYATWNAWVYASTHHGLTARAHTFLTFVPVLTLTSLVWAMLWASIIWLSLRFA
jgi:hypothetical protein